GGLSGETRSQRRLHDEVRAREDLFCAQLLRDRCVEELDQRVFERASFVAPQRTERGLAIGQLAGCRRQQARSLAGSEANAEDRAASRRSDERLLHRADDARRLGPAVTENEDVDASVGQHAMRRTGSRHRPRARHEWAQHTVVKRRNELGVTHEGASSAARLRVNGGERYVSIMAGSTAPFTNKSALVRTKRTWLFVASVLICAVGFAPMMVALLSAVFDHHNLGLLGFAAYYAGFIGTMHAWNRWWREERRALRADETGLWSGERCVVRRSAVRHGHIIRRDGRVFVRLGRMLRLVEIEVADDEEGEALLAAMRLDAARSVAQYPMAHGTWRGSLIRAAVCLAPLVVWPVALIAGLPLLIFLALLFASAIGTVLYSFNQMLRVSVGADGVRIRHLLQRARFVPFSAIDDALTDGRDITLRLNDGEEIVMHHPGGRGFKPLAFADRADDGRKLVERIKTQVAVHRARGGADAPVFARAGRDTAQWLRDVAGATDVHASYRTPAIPPDELWRIVEDAAAPPTARAGAAVALRGGLDEDGRVRLRATADACAAPRLRVALETVASGEDEEELRGVLEPLEDQPEPRRARL
ncbi:MAG: hypothetical protein JWO86_1457, partial [Myxococcaceae bacterium]|nr:hypothetical protein [Myxococcaceae bacterium]